MMALAVALDPEGLPERTGRALAKVLQILTMYGQVFSAAPCNVVFPNLISVAKSWLQSRESAASAWVHERTWCGVGFCLMALGIYWCSAAVHESFWGVHDRLLWCLCTPKPQLRVQKLLLIGQKAQEADT